MREIGTITGLRVLTIEEGASLGTVGQVVVDLSQGRVLGVLINTAAGEQAAAASDIQTIGADVVMVSSRAVMKPRAELPELEKFRRPANAAPLQVFTNTGRRLGAVSSVYIDPLEKVVTRYEVSGGPLKDMAEGVLILPIITGSVHGQDAVILPEDRVAQEGRETGGLLARLGTLGQKVKGQAQQTAQTVEKAVDKGAGAVKGRAGELTEKAKGRAKQAAETVEGAVDKGREALKKEADAVKERAEELTEKAKEQAQETAQAVGQAVDKGKDALKKEAEAVKERATDLAEKAKETVTEAFKGEEAAPSPEAEEQPAETAPAATDPGETETEAKAPEHAPARKRAKKETPES